MSVPENFPSYFTVSEADESKILRILSSVQVLVIGDNKHIDFKGLVTQNNGFTSCSGP